MLQKFIIVNWIKNIFMPKKPFVYISYAGGDISSSDKVEKEREALVNKIEETLKKSFDVQRDKKILGVGDSIPEFMKKIGRGKYVVTVISKKYLTESRYTLMEIREIIHRDDYDKKVYPILTQHFPDIFKDDNEIQKIEDEAAKKIKEFLKKIDDKIEQEELRECKLALKKYLEKLKASLVLQSDQVDLLLENIREDHRNEEKLHKKQVQGYIRKIIIFFIMVGIFSAVIGFTSGENYKESSLINTHKKIKQLESKARLLKDNIKHTSNEYEKDDLIKKLKSIEEQKNKLLTDVRAFEENDDEESKEASKIYDKYGAKRSLNYLEQKGKVLELEDESEKIAKKHILRAVMAFDAQEFNKSNKYCQKATTIFPSKSNLELCAGYLFFQDKKKKATELAKSILLLPHLNTMDKADVYAMLAAGCRYTNAKKYFLQSINLYSTLHTKEGKIKYIEELIEYAKLLEYGQKNIFVHTLNTIEKHMMEFSDNIELNYEFWMFKANYYQNENMGAKALFAINSASKYFDKLEVKDPVVSSTYLGLKVEIYSDQNEIKELEHMYLDRIAFAEKNAKKYPLLSGELIDAYNEIINFYILQHNNSKAEEYFIKTIKYHISLLNNNRKKYLRFLRLVLVQYESYVKLRGYEKKAKLIHSKYQEISNKISSTKASDIALEKKEDLFKENPRFKQKSLYGPKINLTEQEKIEIKKKIIRLNKNIENRNKRLNGSFTGKSLRYPKDQLLFFNYADYDKLIDAYGKLGILSREVEAVHKQYKAIQVLAKDNFQKYGDDLSQNLNMLFISNSKENTKLLDRALLIIKKLMKKNRDRYLPAYANILLTKCRKEEEKLDFDAARSLCMQSVDAWKEMQKVDQARYLQALRQTYAELIITERNYMASLNVEQKSELIKSKEKIKLYKQKRADIKRQMEKIKVDTSDEGSILVKSIVIPKINDTEKSFLEDVSGGF